MSIKELSQAEQLAYLAGQLPVELQQANHIDVATVKEAMSSGIALTVQARRCTEFPGRVVAYVIGTDPMTQDTEEAGVLYETVAVVGETTRAVYFDAEGSAALRPMLAAAFGPSVVMLDAQDLEPVSLSTGHEISAEIVHDWTKH